MWNNDSFFSLPMFQIFFFFFVASIASVQHHGRWYGDKTARLLTAFFPWRLEGRCSWTPALHVRLRGRMCFYWTEKWLVGGHTGTYVWWQCCHHKGGTEVYDQSDSRRESCKGFVGSGVFTQAQRGVIAVVAAMSWPTANQCHGVQHPDEHDPCAWMCSVCSWSGAWDTVTGFGFLCGHPVLFACKQGCHTYCCVYTAHEPYSGVQGTARPHGTTCSPASASLAFNFFVLKPCLMQRYCWSSEELLLWNW